MSAMRKRVSQHLFSLMTGLLLLVVCSSSRGTTAVTAADGDKSKTYTYTYAHLPVTQASVSCTIPPSGDPGERSLERSPKGVSFERR